MCGGPVRPDPSAFVRNLRVDMPLGRKLKLIARNEWIKVRTLQSCCGNHGQPGC